MINNCSYSLEDLLGSEYIEAVCHARSFLSGESETELLKVAREKVEFFPESFCKRQEELMEKVGLQVCEPVSASVSDTIGAPTNGYKMAQHQAYAPVNGYGSFRIGENGKLFFAGKSEHYHIPFGHSFPGYELIEKAKKIGIPNATHNNTRGYVTRLLEQTLIENANDVKFGTREYDEVILSEKPGVLNKVINLETGSLVAEAALKMMLSRFYDIEGKPAKYQDRIPVFLVMGDYMGGIGAGYHGTTIFAQMIRGLWPEFTKKSGETFRVESVAINDADNFKEQLEKWNKPPYKTAGFCHELILMNYSAIKLEESYIKEVYKLCREKDTPILCDEIQSGSWYDSLFLFKKYGVEPDFLSIGKGFPGGCYAASKILVSGAFDSLITFGALVTNGQEEIASLSYLISIAFLKANGEFITSTGKYIYDIFKKVTDKHPTICAGVSGDAHMTALVFNKAEDAGAFCKAMNNEYCIDISAQNDKKFRIPVALNKLPVIITPKMVDILAARFDEYLTKMEK